MCEKSTVEISGGVCGHTRSTFYQYLPTCLYTKCHSNDVLCLYVYSIKASLIKLHVCLI